MSNIDDEQFKRIPELRSGNINFQEYFKEKFSKTGLSAAEFCLKAKISKPLFYFYMQGKRAPAPETMPKLADALGVQVDEFKHLGRASMGRPVRPAVSVADNTVVPAGEEPKPV